MANHGFMALLLDSLTIGYCFAHFIHGETWMAALMVGPGASV